MVNRAASLVVLLASLATSNRLLSELKLTIINYGRSGGTLYGMVKCCEGEVQLPADLTLDPRCRNAQLRPTLCNNVVKVGIHASPSLTFTAPTNDPELKKAAAIVNTALAVGLTSHDVCSLPLILFF